MEGRREKEEKNREDHCLQWALKQEFTLCASGTALKQTHNARVFLFVCFLARGRKSNGWKDGVKTAEECCWEWSEEIRKRRGVDERGQQLEAQREDWKMDGEQQEDGYCEWRALTESVWPCDWRRGKRCTWGGWLRRITERYFRVMEMLLSLIRVCCCETDWARSYSPQVPLISFFSSALLGSFIFLLPRPLLIRRGNGDAVWFGTWFNIRKGLSSASEQIALLISHGLNSEPFFLSHPSRHPPNGSDSLKSELHFITSCIPFVVAKAASFPSKPLSMDQGLWRKTSRVAEFPSFHHFSSLGATEVIWEPKPTFRESLTCTTTVVAKAACSPVGAPYREFGSCQTECKHNGCGIQTVPIAPPSWASAVKWLSHSR